MAMEQMELWNRASKTYADVFEGQATQLLEPTLDAANVTAGDRVLDVGTGPGILAAAAARRGALATGTDFAEEMIAEAARRYPSIEFKVGDAISLPFDDQRFDAVVMGLTLFLLSEPDRALGEAFRVLVPGGRLVFTVWDGRTPGHALFYEAIADLPMKAMDLRDVPLPLMAVNDPAVLSNYVADAGFVDPKVEKLPVFWELESASHLFDAFSPMFDTSALTAEQIAACRTDLDRRAIEYKQADRYLIPFPALLVSCRKP